MSSTRKLARLLKEMQDTQHKIQQQLCNRQPEVPAGQLEVTKKVEQRLEDEKTDILRN